MAKSKINYRKILIEALSISFAVFLALGARQWGESYNHNKLAKKVIVNIAKELNENKEIMDEVIPYQRARIHEFDSIISILEEGGIYNDSIKNLEITLISSTAWEMAKITNAIYYIDFEKVNTLASVYNLQSYYESIVKQYILNNTGLVKDNNDIESLNSKKLILEALIPLEENLKQYYTILLDSVIQQ